MGRYDCHHMIVYSKVLIFGMGASMILDYEELAGSMNWHSRCGVWAGGGFNWAGALSFSDCILGPQAPEP